MLYSKRIWVVVLACLLLLGAFCACAEENNEESEYIASLLDAYWSVPDSLTYQGGIVGQGRLGGIAVYSTDNPLELAYALTNSPYIILDAQTVWDVVISGGAEPYQCQAVLAYQADLSLDPFADSWTVPDYFAVTQSPYPYTFTQPGRYFFDCRRKADPPTGPTNGGVLSRVAGKQVAFRRRSGIHNGKIPRGKGFPASVGFAQRNLVAPRRISLRQAGRFFPQRSARTASIDDEAGG